MTKLSRGFTLIETMTAVFILSVGISGVLVIFPLSLKIIRSSDLATKAVALGQEKMEDVSSIGYEGIAVGTTNENLAVPFDMFTRQTTVSYVDPSDEMEVSEADTGIKKVQITVSWNSLLIIGQQNVTINALISKL